MTRRKKILLIILIIIIAIPLNLLLVARLLLSSERIRKRVETVARQQLNCDISIGDADISLTGMVRLSDLILAMPNRTDAPFLSVDSLLLDTSPLLLLAGEEGIREVEIIKPELVVDEQLLAFLSELQPGEPLAAIPRRITLQSGTLQIDEGLIYENSPPLHLTGLKMALTSDSLSASQFSVKAEARHLVLGEIHVSGTLDLASQTLAASIELPSVAVVRQFRNLLPAELHEPLEHLGLGGRISPAASITYSWNGERPVLTHSFSAVLQDCSIRLKDFPLPVTHVNGVIQSDGHRIEIRRAIARYKTGTIEVTRGSVDAETADLEILGRQLPLDDTVINALPREALSVVQELGIHGGEADINYRLFTRHREQKIPDHSLTLHVRNVSGKYKDFPYPLSRVNGRVAWENPRLHSETPGRVEVELQAAAGKAAATINGKLVLPVVKNARLLPVPDDDRDAGKPDLTITMKRMKIDDQLRSTIPPELHEILKMLRAEGNVDAAIMFRMRHDGKKFQVESKDAVISLNGVSVRPEEFPYPVTNLTGRIEWDGRRARLTEIRGFGGAAKMTIVGEIATSGRPSDDTETSNIIVNIENLNLDEKLRQALDIDSREIWYTFWPEGSTNAVMQLGIGQDGRLDIRRLVLNLQNCRVRYADFHYPIEDLSGQIVIEPNKSLEMLGMRGFAKEARVQLTGRMNLPPGRVDDDGPEGANRIYVIADGLTLDATLRAALNDELQKVWDSFSPSGRADAFCIIDMSEPASPVRTVRLDLDHASARLNAFPYPVKNLTGKIIFEQDIITLENISGQAGNGTFRISGVKSIKTPAEDTMPEERFNLTLRDIALDGTLRAALPADWIDRWLEYRPHALVSAELGITLGKDGSFTITPGSTASIKGAALKGTPLPDSQFNLAIGNNTITITNLEGSYYAGQVKGRLKYEIDSDTFDTAVQVYNIDLKQLNDDIRLWKEEIRGFVSGGVTLSGLTGDINTWKGETTPDVQVNHGQLANIPLFTQLIISLLNLRWPGGDTLTDARLAAKLQGGRIKFSEITLTGTAVPVTGAGKVYLDGRIKMDFYTSNKGGGGFINMIPVVNVVYKFTIGQLTSRLKNLIIQVEVTGTLDEPVIKAVPFASALAPIDSLLKTVLGASR